MGGFIPAMLVRETRAEWRRLLLFVLSIAAGVGGLVAVKAFSAGVEGAIRGEARSLMASDLALTSHRPFTPEESAALEGLRAQGAEIVVNRSFAAMASAESNGQVHLVDVRAVGAAYPFYGEVRTASGRPFRELLNEGSVLVHGPLLSRFRVKVGDSLRIGNGTFRIAGEIVREPDRTVQLLALGPQLMISAEGARATGLLGTTSRVHYQALVKLPPGGDAGETVRALREKLKQRSARIRTFDESQPRVRRFLGRLTDYLNLVGLTALILGGIGVAGAIRAFLSRKLDTLAILKCLGASSRQLLTIYLCQALLLGLAGSLLGAAVGLGLQGVLINILADFLPLSFSAGFAWGAVLQGVALGLVTTVWFALPPLLLVRKVRPARVFRRHVETGALGRRRRLWQGAFRAGSTLLLVGGLVVWQVGPGRVAWIAIGGLAGTTLALQASAWALLLLLRHIPKPPLFVLKQGLSSLYRPGNQTSAVVVSLGLAVLLVLSVILIQGDLLRQITTDAPGRRPNLFFVDIQPSQRQAFSALLNEHGVKDPELVPLVRGRLRALGGKPIRKNEIEDPERRRLLGWEYSFTYRDRLTPEEKVIAGEFSPPGAGSNGAVVSIAKWWADATGMKPGQTITLDIQGVLLQATISSIRRIDWTERRINFPFVFLPGALEKAPQVFVAAARVKGRENRAELQRRLVAALPNISIIDVQAILKTVQSILDRIGLVIQFMAGFSLAVGLVILLGTIATTKYERIREAVLFKTLGATRQTVGAVLTCEYLLLGGLAGLVGSAAAAALSWTLVHFVFGDVWEPRPLLYAAGWGATALLVAVAGLAGSLDVLMKKPLQVLREE